MAGNSSHPVRPVLNLPESAGEEIDLFADDADIERASRSLKAMSHPLRLKILCTLGDQEISVQEIVEHVGTSQSNISQHLEQLRNKNIVVARKEANRIYYRIRNAQLLDLIGIMREVLCPANLDDRAPH